MGQSNQKKKKKLIKKRYKLKPEVKIYLFLFFGALIFVFSSFKLFFRTKTIDIDDSSRYSYDEIKEASGIEIGSSLLLLNKNDVKQNICNKLPYIEDVNIHKTLPDKIFIGVCYAKASFSLEKESEYILVSEKNKILEKANSKFENVILVKGLAERINENGQFLDFVYENDKSTINKIMEETGNIFGEKIVALDLYDLNKIYLSYEDRINIYLGDLEDLNYKLLTAKEIIENKIDLMTKGRLDVSAVGTTNKSYFKPE